MEDEGASFVWAVESSSWNEAHRLYYEYRGWGEYNAFDPDIEY